MHDEPGDNLAAGPAQMADDAALDYESPRGKFRPARSVLAALGVATIAAIVFLAAAWWRPAITWAEYQVAWRQCASHALPPSQVVYDENWDTAPQLATRPGYRPLPQPCLNYGDLSPPPAEFRLPSCYVPPEISLLPPQTYPGIAFLHERRLRGGTTRLVAVGYAVGALGPGDHVVMISGWAVKKGSLPSSMVTGAGFFNGSIFTRLSAGERLRLFAGQPDSTDGSHLTIRYEVGGSTGTIDAWLRAGPTGGIPLPLVPEYVKATVRDGPLAEEVFVPAGGVR